MLRFRRILAATVALCALASPASGADGDIARIIDEGLSHSQAMVNASELMDGIGPRLTNSENFDKAADWALAKFRAYGLENVHREPYRFGLGWNLDSWSAKMVEPRGIVTSPTSIPPM